MKSKTSHHPNRKNLRIQADHMINKCMMVTRTEIIYDVYSLEREHVEIVVARIKMFLKLAEEKKVMEENKDK